MDTTLLGLALIAGPTVKVLIDLLRMATPTQRWMPPLLAVLGGVVVVLCGLLADGAPIGTKTLAEAVLAGIMAGGNAVGITEISKRGKAQEPEEGKET